MIADDGFFGRKTNASRNGSDWYYDIEMGRDCSTSACVVSEPEYDLDGNPVTAVEVQVQAQARCWDATAQMESPYVASRPSNYTDSDGSISMKCPAISNTSMWVVSVGKRIEGDTIERAADGTNKLVRLKNARKVYSFTVGDLSWQPQDLAEAYGAECVGVDPTLCHGLRYKLDSTGSDRGPGQHLLIGSRYIPMHLLQATATNERVIFKTDTLPLVSFAESKLCGNCDVVPSSADLVLPRRFAHVTAFVNTSERSWESTCSGRAEDFIIAKETNHLYMEKSLQPAYTAALFFLFQDGVVRDVLDLSMSSSSGASGSSLTESLAFLRNTQFIDVTLSSSVPNVVLTLVGCAILLFICVGVGVFGAQREARLQRMATAHTFAEVLTNDKKFPSLLVTTALSAGAQKSEKLEAAAAPIGTNLNGFRVSRITMVHPDGRVVELDPQSHDTTRGVVAV